MKCRQQLDMDAKVEQNTGVLRLVTLELNYFYLDMMS